MGTDFKPPILSPGKERSSRPPYQRSWIDRVLSSPGLGLLGWGLAIYLGFLAAFSLVTVIQGTDRTLLLRLSQAAAPCLAATLCWLAAGRSTAAHERRSWQLLALAAGVWASGRLVLALVDLTDRQYSALTWAIHITLVACYALTFLGAMFHQPAEPGRINRLNWALDTLLVAFPVVALGTQVGPVLPSPPELGDPADVIGLWGGVLLSFALAAVLLAWRAESAPARVLILPVALAAFAGAEPLALLLPFGERTSSLIIVGTLWSFGYILLCAAAIARLRSESDPRAAGDSLRARCLRCIRSAQMALRLLPFPAAALLLFVGYLQVRSGSAELAQRTALLALSLLAMVAARQLLALLENQQLRTKLTRLSQELEERVVRRTEELARRTEQLALTNSIASELSRCLTTKELVATGLDLACRATGASHGAVWLLEPSGQPGLALISGEEGQAARLLADLPERAPFLRQAFAAGNEVVLRRAELESLHSFQEVPPEIPGSVVLVPLRSRGTTLGAVGLALEHGRSTEDWEYQLSRAIGAEMGGALESIRRYEELRALADRDSVTGLLNHRAIHQRLDQELRRAQRAGERLSVLMMDLDGFKLFNDTYGHQVGDVILKRVGELLIESTRGMDVLGRYGGDEFVAIMPNTDSAGAKQVAERIRANITAQPYITPDGMAVPIHLSIGVATYPYDAQHAHELMGAADANLYESKQHGNAITVGDLASYASDIVQVGQFGVLDGLVTAVDNKDRYTRRHSEDVTTYALALAKALGLPEEMLTTLRIAAMLHDVGKIGVPYRILRKPGRLRREELEVFKQHVVLGEMMIKDVPNISDVLAAVGTHHERFDGDGYPRRLRGPDIPLLGRILAVADAYSAMTTDRPYRKAMGFIAARDELRRVAGTQLDPTLVQLFLRISIDNQASQTELSVAGNPLAEVQLSPTAAPGELLRPSLSQAPHSISIASPKL